MNVQDQTTEDIESEVEQISKWDPAFTERMLRWIRPLVRGYHRAELRGLERFPTGGGALVVSNHSGGPIGMDSPVFADSFYEWFGYSRPLYTLSHDILFRGPQADYFRRFGFIPARHGNASAALRSGGVVMVFPGGDYDVYRPSRVANKIDFGGRTGYVKSAVNAGVPIVPCVSIGGQEVQYFISRGEWLARMARLDKLFRLKIMPISVGVPFGLSVGLPINMPLPSKIVTEVLEPIHVAKKFGEDPDIDEVDAYVRGVMQDELDMLADERCLPVVG